MGRIKTKLVKRLTNELIKTHSDDLAVDFESNKKVVDANLDGGSKKLRNVIAGYASRRKRKISAAQ